MPNIIRANNRQLKILRFFGFDLEGDVSYDSTRDIIGEILAIKSNRNLWQKYVYLTGDLDSASPMLKDFDPEELLSVELPKGWHVATAEREYQRILAAKILNGRGLFDSPQPDIVFQNRIFMFTGKFALGVKEVYEVAVSRRGGLSWRSASVCQIIDYLVVGTNVISPNGQKFSNIEAAVVERETHGQPAIITQAHWNSCL